MDAVKSLPTVRARALTIPFSPLKGQVTKEQSHSVLLTKLPWELRLMIYREVLGGHVLHIMRVWTRLRCLANVPEDDLDRQWNKAVELDEPKFEKSPPRWLLSLVMTCRQVYSETIDIIYSQNVFQMNQADSIIYLSSTVLEHRFNAIRFLQLNLYYSWPWYPYIEGEASSCRPYDEETWQNTWHVIAGMKSLQSMQVILSRRWRPERPESEAQLFAPMCAVKGLRVFEVELRWPAPGGEGSLWLDNVPYTIKRSP